ncbi:uncharacterized protein METZ01_LOCUS383710 [marine metagenome]|uniref:Uncharacterized protein n=1 Tax=marine metagenome TaxID=408172 RepID=A0A382U986_9ZZZZ
MSKQGMVMAVLMRAWLKGRFKHNCLDSRTGLHGT